MTPEKWIALGAVLFGIAVWGMAGFALGGWNGLSLVVGALAVIASIGHSVGALWTYFTKSEALSPDVRAALSQYANQFYPKGNAPDGGEGFIDVILRDWLIGHGYLQPPREAEDQI